MDNIYFDACMKRINSGDKSALKEIYEEYLSYVYSTAYSILQTKEDTEDVTSEVFIKLWNNSSSYKPGGGHKGYLATITRNLALDLLRKRKHEADKPKADDEMAEGMEAETVYEGFENQTADRLTLENALKTLSTEEREIIGLKVYCQHTFKEIAEILNLPMGTVSWRYREAINKLKRLGYE